MPKTNLKLLQEALAKGDIEAAQALADKMAKPPKVKPKSKPKPKVVDDYEDESSYIISPRPDLSQDTFSGRTFVGADGKEHRYAKRVSMENVKFVNNFNPDDYGKMPAKHEKLDKKLKALKITPRPGQPGAKRDVSKKVPAQCVICHQTVMVYPWEAETVDGESNFRCSKRSCVKAR